MNAPSVISEHDPTEPGGPTDAAAGMSSALRRRTRPRDGRGNAMNDRPRDALGRPLPRGSIGVPRQPEGIERTPAETLDLAEDLLGRRRPFHAHDVFEDHWKHTEGPERRLWRGLAQLAVGVTHAARGNPRGSAAVLERAADSIAPFLADPPHGLALRRLHRWALREAERAAAVDGSAQAQPEWLEVPRLRTRRDDSR